MIGLIAVSISRVGSMIQQVTFSNWIYSFQSVTFTTNQITAVWQEQCLLSNCCAIPFVILAGKLADKVSAKILIPGALIFQICVMVAYCFVKFPTNWGAYVCACFQVGSTMMVIVTMQSYVSKRCPKNIRGMIFAVIGVLNAFGSIFYLVLQTELIRLTGFEGMVFGTVALIDLVWLIFLVAMILIGKFGQAAAGTEDGEDQEDMELRGPDAGKGGYADIPQLDDK